jgi:sugar (pentulose or hexulose) kinase
MDKKTTIAEIAMIEAEIKALTKKRDELRNEAVTNGWATWEYTVRMSAPSLAWWKENRPTVWQKYAKPTQVKKFTLV